MPVRHVFSIMAILFFGCKTKDAINIRGHEVVKIPTGKYMVGNDSIGNNPSQMVETRGFYISTTETTNAQFAKFIEETGYVTEAEKKGFSKVFRQNLPEWEWKLEKGAYWRFPYGPDEQGIQDRMDHPVTQISALDAKAYCKWVGGRLPTTVEWEIAARAGSRTKYPWGNELTLKGGYMANTWQGDGHRTNTVEDGYYYTASVKSFPPNDWGLYDVIGNVFEYCENDTAREFNGQKFVFNTGRGGSWWCSPTSCDYMNLLRIGEMRNTESICNQGFRVAFDPD